MKESTTYQSIIQEGLQEGAVQEARKLLLRLGSKQFGKPGVGIKAQLEKLGDLDQLEALIEQLGKAESWKHLLTNVVLE